MKILEPLGHTAKEKNDKFQEEYAALANRFTIEFSEAFVTNGKINWDALVLFNSAELKP
ncbi:MAG: hypothetical protein QGI51_05030 [Dehalococcoidales bacterium]|nr:hypothetical protein [Dehalococcoidales bacterium]MDP6632847.1 hypothetical protein [Dehalococcoidales bacterium]